MLVIKHYTEIGRETWNNFVYSNSMGWAYHLWDVNSMDNKEKCSLVRWNIWDKDERIKRKRT